MGGHLLGCLQNLKFVVKNTEGKRFGQGKNDCRFQNSFGRVEMQVVLTVPTTITFQRTPPNVSTGRRVLAIQNM
jgi:hypothetical protein